MPNKELKEIEGAIKECEEVIAYMEKNHRHRDYMNYDIVSLSCMELVKEIMEKRHKSHIMKMNGKDIEVYPSVHIETLKHRYQQIRSQK